MVLLGTVDVDDYMACLFRSAAAEHNVPAPLLFGIAMRWTELNPTYNTTWFGVPSVGIFGLRIFAAAAVSMPRVKAFCVREQLQVAAPLVAQAWAAEPDKVFSAVTCFHINLYLRPLGFGLQGEGNAGNPTFIEITRLSTDPATQAYGQTGPVDGPLQLSPAVGPGTLFEWPAFDAAVCSAGIPPPPPLGGWCEPYAPSTPASVESLIDAHMDRVAVLADGTYI